MQILTPGHKYIAENFDKLEEVGQTIQFIEKERAFDGVLETKNDGTTNEELLEILLDRLNFLNSKFPCRENEVAITHIATALLWLNKRTSDRIKRGVEGKHLA